MQREIQMSNHFYRKFKLLLSSLLTNLLSVASLKYILKTHPKVTLAKFYDLLHILPTTGVYSKP